MCARAICLTLLLAAVCLFVIGSIVCNIVALITDYWLYSSDSEHTHFLRIGLYQACFEGYKHPHETPKKTYDGCHGLTSDYYSTIQDWLAPAWLTGTRTVSIIALILQLVATLCFILLCLWWFCQWVCCDGRRACCSRCLMYAAPILYILSGMFLMSACMMFADNAYRLQCKDFWVGGGDPNNNTLGWSWGVQIASCILSFLAGGFLIWLVALKARDEDKGL